MHHAAALLLIASSLLSAAAETNTGETLIKDTKNRKDLLFDKRINEGKWERILKKDFEQYFEWINSWESDERDLVEWKKKHAKVLEESKNTPDDPDLLRLRKFPTKGLGHRDVVLVMAENRLNDPLYAASIAQKMAYARMHNYSFYLSRNAYALIDKDFSTIPDSQIIAAKPVERMCKAILQLPIAKTFSPQLRKYIEGGAEISKTRKPMKGIGSARAATTDPELPMYIKKSLWYVLDNVDPPNGNWNQPFGVLSGTWSKVATALDAMRRSPEGAWLWVLDSDMVIMDMKNGLETIIAKAESEGKEMAAADWQCGDGWNMGSIMLKNTEWARSFFTRMQDERAIWHLYFYHSATGNTEQGAFWTMQAGDPELQSKLYAVPPRALNCRDAAIECAGEAEKMKRVYCQEGDFLIHYAALIRGEVGMALFLKKMAQSGWWPCDKERCGEAKLKSFMPPASSATAPDALPPSCASFREKQKQEAVAKKHTMKEFGVTVVLVDNSTDATASEGKLKKYAEERNFDFQFYPADFYLNDGAAACSTGKKPTVKVADKNAEELEIDVEFQKVKECTNANLVKYADIAAALVNGKNRLHFATTQASRPGLKWRTVNRNGIFLAGTGWARVSVGLQVLESLKCSAKPQWVYLSEGAVPAAGSAFGKELEEIASLPDGDGTTKTKQMIVPHDCKGPWLLRSGEWVRVLLRRVADGWLLRDSRLNGKISPYQPEREAADYHDPLKDTEEKVGGLEALCLLLKRDPTEAKQVEFLPKS